MSFEEDTELKHLVAQTLENKGILPKIRAELRANVFLALEENPTTRETLLKNNELSAFVKIPIGSLILNLIREFLEFFELEFTLSVFDPETKYGKEYNGLTKDKMMKELKLTECSNKSPLLYEVIERVINGSEFNPINEKSQGDLSHSDITGGGDDGHVIPSPIGLNSTYTKAKAEVEFVPVSPIEKENKDEENESIKEELISNNVSESESLGDPKFKLSPKVENTEENLLSSSSSKSNSQKTVPEKPIEIDLLTFTPVKESKPKDNLKPSTLPVQNETKTTDKKESEGTILGDLPPLTIKSDEKEDKMNKIKAIIDKWPGLDNEDESSVGSKSSRDEKAKDEKSTGNLKSDRSDYSQNFSQKSEIAEDFEEDISDLINGHTSSDGQLTIDETISKTSCAVDYLESL